MPATKTWPWFSIAACANLLACGGASPASDGRVNDAASTADAGDAAGDARDIDGAPGPRIRVTVYDENSPGSLAHGARVIFTAPDNTSQTTLTGFDGIAEAISPPDTVATVIQSLSPIPGTAFASFIGLQPGDSVVAGPRASLLQVIGDVTVILPTYPNGEFYLVSVSCPNQGTAFDNVIEVRLFGPCTTASAATLVGRVRNAKNEVIGVSILENVDLLAAIGGTISMPSFEAMPIAVTASLSNVPAETVGTSWFATYYVGNERSMLEQVGANAVVNGSVEFATMGYPVGDRTDFELILHHAGGFSDYHQHDLSRATAFVFDAIGMIKALTGATATPQAIDWSESPTGVDPILVTAAIRWGSTRGVIYSPYTGTSLSLLALPAELQPTATPELMELQYFSVEAATYRDVLPTVEQSHDFARRVNQLPFQTNYWRTSYPIDL